MFITYTCHLAAERPQLIRAIHMEAATSQPDGLASVEQPLDSNAAITLRQSSLQIDYHPSS